MIRPWLILNVILVMGCGCHDTGLLGEADVPVDEVIDITDVVDTVEGEDEQGPLCGDGEVQDGEQCDGAGEVCEDDDGCSGMRACNEDCTLGPCEGSGFGILAGPVEVLSAEELGDLDLDDPVLIWTGSENVVLSGTYMLVVDEGGNVVSRPGWLFVTGGGVSDPEACWSDSREEILLAGRSRIGQGVHAITVGIDGSIHDVSELLRPVGDRAHTHVSCSDSGFGITWVTIIEDSSRHEGYVACLGTDLSLLGTYRIPDDPHHTYPSTARIASSDDGYIVVWHEIGFSSDESYLNLLRLDASCTPVSEPVRLFGEENATAPFDMAVMEGGLAMAWGWSTLPLLGSVSMRASMLDSEGASLMDPTPMGTYEDPDAAITWTGSQAGVLVTYEDPTVEEEYRCQVMLERLRPDGTLAEPALAVYEHGESGQPRILTHDGGLSLLFSHMSYGYTPPVFPYETFIFARYGCLPPD